MRIKDKIKDIEKFLDELASIMPDSFDEYVEDYKTKAACERYAEKIIEAIVDLAFIFIRDKKLKSPEDDQEAFEVLKNEQIISESLANKLKDAKSMRNYLAHKYGEVNDEIVFESLKKELEKDTREFINNITNLIEKKKRNKKSKKC